MKTKFAAAIAVLALAACAGVPAAADKAARIADELLALEEQRFGEHEPSRSAEG